MKRNTNPTNEKKHIYLEAIRILAIFCVMYDHSGPRGSQLFTYTGNPITIYSSLFFAIFCKIGVPLFFMISGTLLINKQESIKELFQKRIIKISLTLFLFSFIRYLYECIIIKTYSFSFLHFINLFVQDDIFLPYWYLYTYISILLLLPLLRNLAQNLHKSNGKYFIVICFIFTTIIPIINYYSHTTIALYLFFESAIIYFITGYIVESLYTDKYRKCLIITSLLIITASLLFMFLLTITNGGYRGDNASAFVLQVLYPLALGIFILFKTINWNKYPKLVSAISYCGKLVFGLYLIEDYLRNLLAFIYDKLAPIISPMPACLVWLTVVFISGTIIVRILKCIPIINKLI